MQPVLIFMAGAAIGALVAWLWARARAAALEVRLEEERKAASEKLVLLETAGQKLSDAFKALSADALERNSQAFVTLARQTLRPVEESLEKVDRQMREIEVSRASAYAGLSEQVKAMASAEAQLRGETANLVSALRAPKARGRWGEMQLRRLLDLTGMVEHRDYEMEASVETESGRLRPDLVVFLPQGRRLVVDAKAPMQAYLDALEATDEAARALKLRQHAQQVRARVEDLGGKAYWQQFDCTPEFVVMFLGEVFFSAALEQDPALIEDAVRRRVVLATPTTLLALLLAVAYGWKQARLAEEAQRIGELGGELYARLCTLGGHFDQLRRGLERAVQAYNDAAGSLEARVLATARKFQEFGPGPGGELRPLEPIERVPRPVAAPDLEPTPRS